MEKRSLGSFIAVLRKSRGMTQRQLAELLNVSDKAVSRWERDESAPDLSLLPVLADVFGVTVDELLRGQKSGADAAPADQLGEKSKKQLENILCRRLLSYKIRSICTVALALAGLICAIIFNSGLNRAYLGFFTGCLFFVAAAACQCVFTVQTWAAVGGEISGPCCEKTKTAIIDTAALGFSAIITAFSASLPLPLFVKDSYAGLVLGDWAAIGGIFAAIALLACLLIQWRIKTVLEERGCYFPGEKKKLKTALAKKYLFIAFCTLVVTVFLNAALTSDFRLYAQHHSFDNYEDFVEFMEQPVSWDGSEPTDIAGGTYYDENGREISWEEAHTRTIENSQGRTVCSYLGLNERVVSVSWQHSESCLPISVITRDQADRANAVVSVVKACFVAVYIIEAAVLLLLYSRARRKL